MKSIKFVTLVLTAVLLASCAGMGRGVKEDDVLNVIEMINAGQSDALIEQSRLPFVFDGEILESDTQLSLLWKGLEEAGFVLDNPLILQQRPVSPEDGALFSDSWEIRTYFKNLLDESDSYVEVQGSSGTVHMILRPGKASAMITAWKGESR